MELDEAEFHQLIEDWMEHCRNPHLQASSSSEPVRACDSYKRLLSIGHDALPLIRDIYEEDVSNFLADMPYHMRTEKAVYFIGLNIYQLAGTMEEVGERNFSLDIVKGYGLVSLVKKIVGEDFSIPEKIQDQIPEMQEYTINWLDNNINRYLTTQQKIDSTSP